jgi:hypothetical protein
MHKTELFEQVKKYLQVNITVWRIRDVYPRSRILILPIPDPESRIPDPKTATKERDEKKFDVIISM